MNAFISNVAY